MIIYSSPDDKKKNRGFCFLEYESHKAASLAKRRLETGRVKVWSCDIIVDWADPQEEPDEDTMSQVRYVEKKPFYSFGSLYIGLVALLRSLEQQLHYYCFSFCYR